MTIKKDPFAAITPEQLVTVSGGAARVTGKGDDAQLEAMLTQLGSSIKDLAGSKNASGGDDTMQMMMMMLMMGGMGGGGGAIAPAGSPSVINISAGGCRRGRKRC